MVVATLGEPPPSPVSNGAVSRSRSKTNSATEVGANGSQFQVPPSGAAASEDPASTAASATAAAASGAPASVQVDAGGAEGGLLATQRHQFLALTWRQMGTATVGSHMPPVAAAGVVPVAPSIAPPPSLATPVGQSATAEGMLVTLVAVYGFSTMSISVRTGAPGWTP